MINSKKRIALFVGQADEGYQSRFITGFLENAFALDMDANASYELLIKQ